MMKSKRKSRKRVRFFNRPIKLGLGFAGIGASLEFGKVDIYDIIQDPKLIFWLEIVKYACYIIGVLFASGGVFKQAKEDFESIKIGEKVKEVVSEDIRLKRTTEKSDDFESINLEKGFEKVKELATKILTKREKRKAKRNE